MSNPRKKHQTVVKHIFQYLHGVKDIQLMFGLDHPTEVEGYTDSDYVENYDNLKSTSRYVSTTKAEQYYGGPYYRRQLDIATSRLPL